MSSKAYDIAIIGGGIVGLATARALSARGRTSVAVLEAEDRPATHQTGHNSGVIHSGLYYAPGSFKARGCAEGREALYRFCERHGVEHERCGKVVVATTESEVAALDRLQQRGVANGLAGLRRLGPEELREYEPHCAGVAALFVPQTGIVDFTRVAAALVTEIQASGAVLLTGHRIESVDARPEGLVLRCARAEIRARALINCAGLQADRVARLSGASPDLRIVPFLGEYFRLVPRKEGLVRNLIYPVPDPRFPFLGVHFTRRIGGGIEAGPNALLALSRDGYRRSAISPRDAFSSLSYGGFWRMAARYWRTGLGELHRSVSTRALAQSLARLVPGLEPADLVREGVGIRAQAIAPDGAMVDDFHILEGPRMLHVLNAPSPAATASLSIGETLAAKARETFGS